MTKPQEPVAWSNWKRWSSGVCESANWGILNRIAQVMGGAGEARHVPADLRHDDAGRQVREPGRRRQQVGALLDRRQRFSHCRIQLGLRSTSHL